MLDEGSGYVDDAQKRLDKDLAAGTGNVSVTDKLRMRTVRAELDGRILEAKRLQGIARDSLRTLLGPEAPTDMDVDDEEFGPPEITSAGQLLRGHRALEPARGAHARVRGQGEARARRSRTAQGVPGSGVDRRRRVRHAQTVDDPQNAFTATTSTAGGGRGGRAAHAAGPGAEDRARAQEEAEALEVAYRRSEALGGIMLEVRKTFAEASEASARVEAMDKGEKAGRAWISAVAQNFAVGLAEAAICRTRSSPSSVCGPATCRRSSTWTSRARRWAAPPGQRSCEGLAGDARRAWAARVASRATMLPSWVASASGSSSRRRRVRAPAAPRSGAVSWLRARRGCGSRLAARRRPHAIASVDANSRPTRPKASTSATTSSTISVGLGRRAASRRRPRSARARRRQDGRGGGRRPGTTPGAAAPGTRPPPPGARRRTGRAAGHRRRAPAASAVGRRARRKITASSRRGEHAGRELAAQVGADRALDALARRRAPAAAGGPGPATARAVRRPRGWRSSRR